MVRKMFLGVYHAVVLSAAIFGNLEAPQKTQLLRHLRLEKAYQAPAVRQARTSIDRTLKKLSRDLAREIHHAWRN